MKFTDTCRKYQANYLTLPSILLLTALPLSWVIGFSTFQCATISFNDLKTNCDQVNIYISKERIYKNSNVAIDFKVKTY